MCDIYLSIILLSIAERSLALLVQRVSNNPIDGESRQVRFVRWDTTYYQFARIKERYGSFSICFFVVYLSFVRCWLHESTSIVLGIVPEWRNTFCRWQNHCSTRCRKQTEYTYKSLLCLIFFSLYHSLCRLHSWLVNCLWKVANASQIPTAHGLRSHSFVDHFFVVVSLYLFVHWWWWCFSAPAAQWPR